MTARPAGARPPGSWVERTARGLSSPRTWERIVEPALADLQHEHRLALAARSRVKAEWVRARGYLALARALLLHSLLASSAHLAENAFGASPNERRIYRGLALFTPMALLVSTAILLGDRFSAFKALPLGPAARLAILAHLVPSAAVVAVPMSLLVATVVTLRGFAARPSAPVDRRRDLRSVAAFSSLTMLATFAVAGWVMPEENQRQREMTFEATTGARRPLARGSAELTVAELPAAIRAASANADPVLGRSYEFQWHSRFALPAGCLVLAALGVGIAWQDWRRPSLGIVIVWASAAAYGLLVGASWRGYVAGALAPWVAAWGVDLLGAAIAAALIARPWRQRDSAAPPPSASVVASY